MTTLVVLVIACAIAVASAHYSPWARNRRALLATEKRAIAELGPAYARIAGTVVALETIEAPLTRRPCVYYEVVIELDGRRLVEERRGVPFLVEEEARRALVEPTDVTAVFTRASVAGPTRPSALYEDPILDPDAVGQGLLRSRGHTPTPDHRYIEMCIEPGARIAVAGHGIEEVDPDPRAAGAGGYRGGPATRIHMVGSRAHPLMLSDRPETTT